MKRPPFSFQLLSLLAVLIGASCLRAASISGGDETVETVPTPKPGFTRSESDETEPTPAPAPKTFSVENSTLVEGSATPTPTPEAATPTPAPDFRVALRLANKAYRAKDFDGALEQVRTAEALKPNDPEIINFRGAIYAETGRYEEAVKLYEQSIALNPQSFWPNFNLCELDFIQKRYPEARAKFEAAMVKFPNHELLRFKIILCHLLEKNDAAAKAEMDKYTFPANSAAREFSNAAWDFAHGDTEKAQTWIRSGVIIFGMGRTDFLYQSLADVGWVPLPRPGAK